MINEDSIHATLVSVKEVDRLGPVTDCDLHGARFSECSNVSELSLSFTETPHTSIGVFVSHASLY